MKGARSWTPSLHVGVPEKKLISIRMFPWFLGGRPWAMVTSRNWRVLAQSLFMYIEAAKSPGFTGGEHPHMGVAKNLRARVTQVLVLVPFTSTYLRAILSTFF